MRTKLLFAFIVSLIVSSCSKSYDDDAIWKQVNNNTDRIARLEQQLNQINSEINTLKSLVNSLEGGGLTINSVITTANGYIIQFSNGTSATITNGVDGTNGTNGTNGKDGIDGIDGKDAPIIGVDEWNGVYYWTITVNGKTEWLLDKNGNKMRVTGADGSNGNSGTQGQPGKDGVTPQISVDKDGYWIVSYDNGKTWQQVKDANGKPVYARDNTPVSESSVFDTVMVINDAYIEFVLRNGKYFMIPIDQNIALEFTEVADLDALYNTHYLDVPFKVIGANYKTDVKIVYDGNLSGYVDYWPGDSKGTIHLTLEGELTKYTQVLVFLCNDYKTLTYSLKLTAYTGSDEEYTDDRLIQVVPEDILEKVNEHMNIYEGVNPPNIEGGYLIDPMVSVYCSDGYFKPGDKVVETYIRFKNQNDRKNTIDYEEKEGTSTAVGLGAFISGSGNNFTAFFNTDGVNGYDGTKYKTALVISGTKTNQGIKNIEYAFVMVYKSAPSNLMEVGGFRIFKDNDNLATNATWSFAPAARSGAITYPSKLEYIK